MKNKKYTVNILMVMGVFCTAIISCKKADGPLTLKTDDQSNPVSRAVSSRGKTKNNYSDTFRLVSYSGKKIQVNNTFSSVDIRYEWSAVGETNVAYYALDETYPTNIYPTNPTDSLTYRSTDRGYGGAPGRSYTYSVRLKITLKDGRVKYSNYYTFSYRGKSNFF